MIVIKVELWSAISGQTTELARMVIANEGANPNPRRGDYTGETYIGRDRATLERAMLKRSPVSKRGRVENHARLQEHVWNLVAKMLSSMGYGAAK